MSATARCAHPGCGRTIYSVTAVLGATPGGAEVAIPGVWTHDPIDTPTDGHLAVPTAGSPGPTTGGTDDQPT
jgi:hypothetical protein